MRGKSHFNESSNPFFPKRRRSFPEAPFDPDERREGSRRGRGRERDWGSRRNSFPKFTPDPDEMDMESWGKERGQRSFGRNKQMERRFQDDYMDDFDD